MLEVALGLRLRARHFEFSGFWNLAFHGFSIPGIVGAREPKPVTSDENLFAALRLAAESKSQHSAALALASAPRAGQLHTRPQGSGFNFATSWRLGSSNRLCLHSVE